MYDTRVYSALRKHPHRIKRTLYGWRERRYCALQRCSRQSVPTYTSLPRVFLPLKKRRTKGQEEKQTPHKSAKGSDLEKTRTKSCRSQGRRGSYREVCVNTRRGRFNRRTPKNNKPAGFSRRGWDAGKEGARRIAIATHEKARTARRST